MKQDITLAEVRKLKQELEDKIRTTGIGALAGEFYDKTGIMLDSIHLDWVDATQYGDPYLGYRMILARLWCDYEKVTI